MQVNKTESQMIHTPVLNYEIYFDNIPVKEYKLISQITPEKINS